MSLGDANAINVYVVTVGGSRTTEQRIYSSEADFQTAVTYLRNHISDDHIRQIKASEGFPLIASGRLTKKDVFLFDRFEGDFFKQLQQTKALLVGPRCLTTCLLKFEPIPLGTSPVYTTAMRNLQMSATGISTSEKERLRVLIQWMGGYYFADFGRSVTHLISNTIKSTKYEQATLNNIPVMHVDWVERVWERSCVENVAATDGEFEKYRLPLFFGTNITSTGLEVGKKNEIARVVNENGGSYQRSFRSQLVDIVITEKNKTDSEKYKAAVMYRKDILLPEWIFDSVQKGFALPTKAYRVKSLNASTPTKSDQSVADFTNADQTQFSDLSRISVAGPVRNNLHMSAVNETVCSIGDKEKDHTFVAPSVPASGAKDLQREVLKKNSSGVLYRKVLEEISLKAARNAGSFLDGCCIYLSGFSNEEREKLNRILNVGGATRYDAVNEKITHIIVGQLDDGELRSWKKDGILSATHIVRLDWLRESIKLKQPASEVVYRMSLASTSEPDAPSPSSKKTLLSMNHSFKQPDLPVKKKLFEHGDNEATLTPMATSTEISPFEQRDEDDHDVHNLMAQYSQENVAPAAAPLPPVRDRNKDTNTSNIQPIASSTQSDVAAAKTAVAAPGFGTELTNVMSTIDYENLDFFQGVSVFVDKEHFPDEFYTQMINECEAAQGNLVATTFRDTVDYAIVSFERTLDERKLPVKARHIITELYVETCLKQNKLVPIEYYHKHIPHNANSLPLQGMTVVVSIYSGLERDFIDSLAQLLGARVNKVFAKKERPLLVCPQAEGSKYEGALKWGYPIVTSAWLVQCAEHGEKLSYQPYLVGDSAGDFPISPTLQERSTSTVTNTAAKTLENRAAPRRETIDTNIMEINRLNNSVTTPTSTHTHITPDVTPLRNKRVSELAGPSRDARASLSNPNNMSPSTPDSPQTPVNGARPSYNFDYLEGILAEIENEAERETLREVIMEMRNNQTPELERIRRQACTPINRKLPTPKGIPDFCTTPEFEKRMAEAFERRWRLPTKRIKPDTPIDEIRRRILRATCKAMGILYSDDDVEQQQATDTPGAKPASSIKAEDAQTPLQHFKSRASSSMPPRAIFQQQSHTSKSPISNASATFVPCTQSPNNRSARSSTGLGEQATLLGKSTINFDKISFEETEMGATANDMTTGRASTASTSSPEVKQITEYLKNCETRRQKRSVTCASGEQPAQLPGRIDGQPMETESQYVQPFDSEQLVGTEQMVGWRDPVEFSLERRSKLLVAPMQHKGSTPRFSISCSNDEVREDVIEKIQKLGGEISENLTSFDATCTHLLCERPNRGEKMLGCISSGKYVLSLRYVEECYAKDTFINEELYEWGNCKALNMPQLSHEEQVIAQAAHRWRKQLAASPGTGAFTGFRAILRISERSLDALKKVIKAGKGEIIEASSPYCEANGTHRATHCFVDMRKAPISQADYVFLHDHGVRVFTQIYINSFLMNGSDADFTKYEIKL